MYLKAGPEAVVEGEPLVCGGPVGDDDAMSDQVWFPIVVFNVSGVTVDFFSSGVNVRDIDNLFDGRDDVVVDDESAPLGETFEGILAVFTTPPFRISEDPLDFAGFSKTWLAEEPVIVLPRTGNGHNGNTPECDVLNGKGVASALILDPAVKIFLSSTKVFRRGEEVVISTGKGAVFEAVVLPSFPGGFPVVRFLRLTLIFGFSLAGTESDQVAVMSPMLTFKVEEPRIFGSIRRINFTCKVKVVSSIAVAFSSHDE